MSVVYSICIVFFSFFVLKLVQLKTETFLPFRSSRFSVRLTTQRQGTNEHNVEYLYDCEGT